jgi:hypothetical protein
MGKLLKKVPVKRQSKVVPAHVAQRNLRGVGEPIVITDATESWPARSKWTFDFFKGAYGSDFTIVSFGLGSRDRKITKLSTYIDILDAPFAELPGFWIGEDGRPLRAQRERGTSPPYLLGWRAFQVHPELYHDITPEPYFLLDLVSALKPALREVFEWACQKEYWSVYIGPQGSLSGLHQDHGDTHSYLAQIQGRKRVTLFSPEDSEFLYGGQVDPEQPDFERFPLFHKATAYECVIEPGDTLLTPANWWHHVRGLEKSITVSHNFFDDGNFTEHMSHILRNLPLLVQGIDKSLNCRQELRIEWGSPSFSVTDA